MKFLNKWYAVGWVAIIMALLVLNIAMGSVSGAGACQEEMTMRFCNVTVEKYIEIVSVNESFCPEGGHAFAPAVCGSDVVDDTGYILFFLVSLVAYNLMYVLWFFLRGRKR